MRNISNRESPPPTITRRRPIREKNNKELSEDEDSDYEEEEYNSSNFNDSSVASEYGKGNVSKNSTLERSMQNTSQSRSYNSSNFKPSGIIPECARGNHNSYKRKNAAEKVSAKNNWCISSSIIIVLIIFAVGGLSLSQIAQNTTLKNRLTVQKIKEKFPKQPNETLEDIEAVIGDVLKIEPTHPAVFLFLYDRNTKNDDFISTIANFACDKLEVPQNPIIIDENVYESPQVRKQFGYLIEYYKPQLESQKVMVIKNLHRMPSVIAQALHTFCDDVTPLVDRTVYILTLKVDKYYGNDVHTAEFILNDVWSDLKKDILAPLITRVINTVIRIH